MFSDRRRVAAATAVILALSALAVPLPAAADDEPAAPLEQMTEFSPDDFVAEAAELPPELAEALETDVDLTPEEFLAQGAAAVQAVAVVESLEQTGVEVLGSRLDGTELVVNVATQEDAVTVESTGATAQLGEPVAEWDASSFQPEFAADLYGGQGWIGGGKQCSIAFNGRLVATGAPQLLTAGHCTQGVSGSVNVWNQAKAGDAVQSSAIGAAIGPVVAGSTHFNNDGADAGRIESSAFTGTTSVLTWGGGQGAPLASSPVVLSGAAAPIVGSTLCKSGTRTGWACGPIVSVDNPASVGDPGTLVRSVVAKLCVLPGDSGGAAIVGTKAVGVTSWTTTSTECNYNYSPSGVSPATGSYAGFFQMISPSGDISVSTVYPDWEMSATVSAPTNVSLTTPSAGTTTAISGSVPNAGPNYVVDLYIDGSASPYASVPVNASTSAWSVDVSAVSSGAHTYAAIARYGRWSYSGVTSGSFSRNMTVDRIAGTDRYKTSAAVAAKFTSVSTVFVANGLNYPDALSAAPAAGATGGALVLTDPNSLPSSTGQALANLNPSTVVLLGSSASVSVNVQEQIRAILPSANIIRVAGTDRYATSRAVSGSLFPAGSTTVAYISSGTNFPDALSAAAAATMADAPVILVYGPSPNLDAPTRDILVSLGVQQVYITGSTASVSQGIQDQIDAIPGISVARLAGPDRYATSVAINQHAFPFATDVYLAVGTGFADALAGAALAGRDAAPLFVVPSHCVPVATLNAISSMGATRVHLLGGTPSLSEAVAALTPC